MMYKLILAVLLINYLSFECSCQFTLPYQPIKDALFLHNTSISNATLRDCPFRPNDDRLRCPDPDIRHILYSGDKREVVNYDQSDWLRQSIWDHTKEDVILVHGYSGDEDGLPMLVLRDAYLTNGSFNVWIIDWGKLTQPPCYRASVNNMKAVAKCTGNLFTKLREAGLNTDRLTCVGHSLGAHICGLMSRYVLFRIHRIVAMDPARPLVPQNSRLEIGDAAAVHVIHTNAGHYGEMGKSGHVDFCVNGGRIQPYCENSGLEENLCSHVWVICYMAESLDPRLAKKADPCSRRCPSGPRPGHRIGIPVVMGQHTPPWASGSYCLRDSHPPYCPVETGAPGDKRCCLKAPPIAPAPVTEPMSRKFSDAQQMPSKLEASFPFAGRVYDDDTPEVLTKIIPKLMTTAVSGRLCTRQILYGLVTAQHFHLYMHVA